MSRRRRPLASGLLLGVIADALLPDPRRGHPVALFGAVAGRAERALYADTRWRGTVFAAACVGGVAVLAAALPSRTPLIAAATWTVLGGRSLRAEAAAVRGQLAAGDLEAARRQITHLVGRDPAFLDAEGVARAAVESVAENTSDAVVAPLFWGVVAGMPGLLGYRAANTLDAMVGHRSARYRRFGWASARLDDVLNFVPARLTAGLTALLAPLVGGDSARAVRITARDGGRHPSPNSGRCEAAFAGALGVRLGGRNVYAGRVEERPLLGEGPPPTGADIGRASRLSAAIAGTAGLLAVAAAREADRRAVRRLLG